MILGKRIKELRKERRLTQSELAKKIGTNQPHLTRWESGEWIPSVPFLKKIASLFNVSLDLLLLEKGDFKMLKLKDRSLLSKLKDIENLAEEDKEAVLNFISSLNKKQIASKN